MIEYWDFILVIVGAIAGYILTKYGLSKYKVTVDVILDALKDGKITEDEAKAIIKSLTEQMEK